MKTLHYIEDEVNGCLFCQTEKKPRMLQLDRGNEVPKFSIMCVDCKARGPEKDSDTEALKSWNGN